MKTLWTEQYRPKIASEYVFRDNSQRQQVETWIAEKSIPHLLFSGGPGTGKTTLAKVLCKALEVEDADVLQICLLYTSGRCRRRLRCRSRWSPYH